MLPIPFGFMGPEGLIAFLDNFNRADSDTVGVGWVEESGDWDIASNQLVRQSSPGGNNELSRPASESFDDGWAEVVLVTSPTATVQGNVLIRFNFTSDSGYLAGWVSTGSLVLVRRDSGSNTQIGSATGLTFASTDVIRIEAIGTAIKVYEDGVQRISVTDANYTTGRQGLRSAASASYTFDDFASQEV